MRIAAGVQGTRKMSSAKLMRPAGGRSEITGQTSHKAKRQRTPWKSKETAAQKTQKLSSPKVKSFRQNIQCRTSKDKMTVMQFIMNIFLSENHDRENKIMMTRGPCKMS